jgi:threonine/homoserine/homoserine lactone efflux protein
LRYGQQGSTYLFTALLQGLVIGFSVNAPIGPVGVFCIRRTLVDGLTAGLMAGLGAAAADGIFGTISALAIHKVSLALHHNEFWMAIVGGLLLLLFAVWTLMRPPSILPTSQNGKSRRESFGIAAKSFFMALGFTLINPLTILIFAAVFAGIDPRATLTSMLSIVLGMFISALICWTILAFLAYFVRLRISKSAMTIINRLSAAAFAAFGLWAIMSAFHP